MAESLKQKTISGMIWNAVERFGSSFFLFVSNLVLARLLSPEDFGCIGMLTVFISVSDAIIDGGFGSALIQKKNPTETDYSTVFYWNLFLSLLLYATLYLAAPAIAKFYEIHLLNDVLRVLGIMLVINAFILIQQNMLKKQVDFKKIAKINLCAIIIGTCAGIIFAFLGYGVWSLVIKSLVTGIVQCIAYWLSNHWRPQRIFSWTSFTNLFKFGSFMFLYTIINNLYGNILSLIIGKGFSATTLGYFIQARKLEEIPRSTLSSVINNVTYPVFSEMQDDKERLQNAARKCLKSMVFVNFPLMMLLIVIAKPLIIFLFTEKWAQSVPYFQVLCLHGLIFSSYELNNNIVISIGKSNISFIVRIVQCIVGILLIIIGLKWGMIGVLLGYIIASYLNFILISFVTGKLIGYGVIQQIKDVFKIFILSIVCLVIVYSLTLFITDIHYGWLLCFQSLLFFVIYLGLSKMFGVKELEFYYQQIKIRTETVWKVKKHV